MPVRNPERYFDHRTVKRHIRRGHVSQTDYQAFLDALPDVTDKIRPRDEGDDDDDDYDDDDEDDFDDDDDDEDDDEVVGAAPATPAPAKPAEPAGPSPFDDDLDDD
ncbi:hypothetical protein ACNOYE_16155 [Nannocystaceae bacterium ST9]